MSWPLLLALGWPLLLAAAPLVPALRARALGLLPLAPLPALALALAAALPGTGRLSDATTGPAAAALAALARAAAGPVEAPGLLLGVVLAPTPAGLLLTGVAAGLWLAAGLMARASMAPDGKGAFAAFWCVTLAGNLGVFLAGDAVTFYVAFAAVSLAAWGLVVHQGSAAALRAGRVYLRLAIFGEVCLLLGLIMGAAAAGSLDLAAIRAALPQAGPAAAVLLILGFGIKAGLVPLHTWLPLAHPAAPVPASAVLSGAIVKAGVIGMALLLPPAAATGGALMALGLTAALGAALYGLGQSNPKAALAYSTVSQMGLVMALLGAALTAAEGAAAAATQAAAMLMAAHHGLAKAALFLAVAAVALSGRARPLALALAGLAALSLAGAPLTGGALAKAAAKAMLPDWAALTLGLSGVTTALLLLHVLRLLARQKPRQPMRGTLLPLVALTAAALALPWALQPAWSDLPPGYGLRAATLSEAAWPLAAALALAMTAVLARRFGLRAADWPPGDLLALLPARLPQPRWPDPEAALAGLAARWPSPRPWLAAAARRAERALMLWRWSGLLLLALLLTIALTAG